MSMRKIYREIARKNGVSVKDVKRDMQAAIAAAYQNRQRTAASYQLTRGRCRGKGKSPRRRNLYGMRREKSGKAYKTTSYKNSIK